MKKIMFVVAVALFLAPFAAAEIFVSQPQSIYSLGDAINVQIRLQPGAPTNDFVIASLVCPQQTVEIYKTTLNMSAGEQREISVSALLTPGIVQNAEGNCKIRAHYGSDSIDSTTFTLSKEIETTLGLSSTVLNPNEQLSITGNSLRKNGQPVQGFAELSIEGMQVAVASIISNGAFSFNVTLPQTAPAGTHTVKVYVYERDVSGAQSNKGNVSRSIQVRAVPREIEIQAQTEVTSPLSQFPVVLNIYDQTHNRLVDDIRYTISDSHGQQTNTGISRAGDTLVWSIPGNYAPGYAKIEAQVGNLSARKLIYINEMSNVSFSIVNNTVVVTNTGNIAYSKPLEIVIGNATFIRDVQLEVGQSKKFQLSAPEAEYEVTVSDGSTRTLMSGVALTGNAIGVEEITGAVSSGYVLWVFLLGVLLLALVVNGYFGNRITTSIRTALDRRKKKGVRGSVALAAGGVVIGGKREDAIAVALHLSAGHDAADGALAETYQKIKKSGVRTYTDDDYRIFLVSQSVVGSKEAELYGVRIAKEIEQTLGEHNKKMKDQVTFGIGVNNGQIIAENHGGIVRVTAVGSLIPGAKKIARGSKGESLVADEVYKKIMTSVRGEKIREQNVWKAGTLVDRESHKGFIDGFLKRQGKK